ncbi:MAG: hypothetical protein U1F77_05455 [Kiritimatiellia bacterium]
MAEKSNDTRSRRAFAKAPPELQKLIKQILEDERTVQHQKRRVMPGSGEGIHEALLRRVKEAIQ